MSSSSDGGASGCQGDSDGIEQATLGLMTNVLRNIRPLKVMNVFDGGCHESASPSAVTNSPAAISWQPVAF